MYCAPGWLLELFFLRLLLTLVEEGADFGEQEPGEGEVVESCEVSPR
jgi:hypothetical protein